MAKANDVAVTDRRVVPDPAPVDEGAVQAVEVAKEPLIILEDKHGMSARNLSVIVRVKTEIAARASPKDHHGMGDIEGPACQGPGEDLESELAQHGAPAPRYSSRCCS